MQTIDKQKPVAGLAGLHGNQAGHFGLSQREYTSLGRFSNSADQLGLKTTGIGQGPLLGVGCRLQLSGKADYEVLVQNGSVLLGKVEKDGRRIRLAEGSSSIEASWEKLSEALRREVAMKCRLRTNIIADGKNYLRDSVIDDAVLPEHLRTEAYVAYELENRSGVLLLRDLSFQSLPRLGEQGIATSFPTHLAAGEVLDLSQVPASKRESLVEGLDYQTKWTLEEQAEWHRTAQDAYLKQFESAEPPEALTAPWRRAR